MHGLHAQQGTHLDVSFAKVIEEGAQQALDDRTRLGVVVNVKRNVP